MTAPAYWIDGHLDLAYNAEQGLDLTRPPTDDRFCATIPTLRDGDLRLVFGTIYTDPGPDHLGTAGAYQGRNDVDGAEAAGRRQLEHYHTLHEAGVVRLVRSVGDLDVVNDDGQPGLMILMEGADPIRDPDHVDWWVERGVRMVGLTWAIASRYAGGNGEPGPLTSAGRDMVAALDAHGVIHDVTHLADAAFDDVMALAKGPIAASHSNCRALLDTDSQRNLRDDQIRALAARGGVIGINLVSNFLRKGLVRGQRASIADCVAHVEHLAAVMGGRTQIGLGSDMDGGFPPKGLPMDLDHPMKLGGLAAALRDAGWSDEEIESFAHGAWERFLRAAWSED